MRLACHRFAVFLDEERSGFWAAMRTDDEMGIECMDRADGMHSALLFVEAEAAMNTWETQEGGKRSALNLVQRE